MSKELTNLLSKRFISRPDVKAIQNKDGSWRPHTDDGKHNGNRVPWTRADLESHLTGEHTFGHYMLSQDSTVKLFAFDVDLRENISEEEAASKSTKSFQGYWLDEEGDPQPFNPRTDWMNRAHPSRKHVKYEFKMLAAKLLSRITDPENGLGLHGAVAYSGGKGVHVYGFLNSPRPAADAREGANMVLEDLGLFEPTKGDNFFQTFDQSETAAFRNFSIEVFPKQDSLEGKNLGNLMRLPLGRNLKNPKDPTFFVDMTSAMGQMVPRDPILALKEDPWKMAHEL